MKLDRVHLRALLVGSEIPGCAPGNGDRAGEVGIVGVQHVKAASAFMRIAERRATHSTPGTPSLRSGHIQRSSGVKRKMNSVG